MKRLSFLIPLIFFLVACTSTKQVIEVPVETVRTEYVKDSRVDSVYIRDSIDRFIKGDTVFIYKESIKYRFICQSDTIIKTDTIPEIIQTEVIKTVEAELKWYQSALMWLGGVLSLFLLIYITYRIRFKT